MIKMMMNLLCALAPGYMTNKAMAILMNPQVKKLREHEEVILQQSQQEELEFNSFSIKTYKWGSGSRKLMLIHGWEGQAGNFSDIVNSLDKDKYTIYAFDAPSHGYSSHGPTTVFEFSDCVSFLIDRWKPHDLISHSFGGVATVNALYFDNSIEIDKYVLLTVPNRFLDRINDVSKMVGISDKVKSRLIAKLQAMTDIPVEEMNIADYAPRTNVSNALILHDVDDKIIDIEIGRAVDRKWPNAKLIEVSGTGHFRILRDAGVIGKVASFLI